MSELIYLLQSHCVFCNNRNINLLKQSFTFKTAPCGHQICTECIDKEFKTKKKGVCPSCDKPMNAASLRKKAAFEMELEREALIRKEIRGQFNLTLKDFNCDQCTDKENCFACLDQFASYQELAETLIWNRFQNINEKWTDDQIAKNLHDFGDKIQTNKAERDQKQRRFQEELELQEIRKNREFRIRVLKDREDRLMKKQEREEAIKVALGQMSESNTAKALAAARAKREAEEEQARKDALLETRFLPAPPRYEANDLERLWPPFKSQSQPRPDKKADDDDDYMDLNSEELRECKRTAGGFKMEEAMLLTEQLMFAGL